jgi:CYTH domain-containing protein
MKEIERKFLLNVDKGVITEEINDPILVIQFYISVDPEVRVRSYGDNYRMTFKTEGYLSREETEIEITKNDFYKLYNHNFCHNIKGLYPIPITKIYYTIMDGKFKIEMSIVDNNTPLEFIYAEIEFQSEEEANSYNLPDWFVAKYNPVEVTNDPYYKMKNYWKRTRLNK